MKTRRTAALFDLDGVIIDSEPVYTGIWSAIDRAFPTGVENFAYKIKGTTLPDILSTYFSEEDRPGVIDMLMKNEEEMPYPLFDGVIDFLTSLHDAGIPTAIVTSSNDEKMERLFAVHPRLRQYFDAVVTDSWVSRGKPDPECYVKAAEALGVDPADCYVFEDSFNGLRAGRAAGAHVVALATTNPRESLVPFADIVVDTLSGFPIELLNT